jgi:hypothetical protein
VTAPTWRRLCSEAGCPELAEVGPLVAIRDAARPLDIVLLDRAGVRMLRDALNGEAADLCDPAPTEENR